MNFVFNTLIHNGIFFLEYVLACYFFRHPTFCRNFFCVDGVKKVGIPLLLLATLAAALFNSKKGFDSRRVLVERFPSLSCGSTAQLTIATPPRAQAFTSRALP